MRITPIDIRKQEFRRAMRGYDIDEVETFLAMVADEMEELAGTAQQARTELASLSGRLEEYQQMEATMRETLVTVQRAAEDKREAAHAEAEIILKEAEVRAGKWIEDAHRSIRDIRKELAKLGGMRDSYVTRLRMLVQAQLDMLKIAEMEEETPDETLDMFEERLEALTAEARARVAAAGEDAPGSDLPPSAPPAADPPAAAPPAVEREEEEEEMTGDEIDEEDAGDSDRLLTVAGTIEDEADADLDETGRAAERAWHGWRKEDGEEREPEDNEADELERMGNDEGQRVEAGEAEEEKKAEGKDLE